MSERDELVTRLRDQRDHADDWRTDLAEQAADLLERDGARIAELEAENARLHRVGLDDEDRLNEARAALDDVSAAIGTNEFMDPPDGGSPSLADQVRRMRAALAEAQQDTNRINWLESRVYRVWVVNPPACMEYELSRSLREALDIAIAKEQSHASE